MNKEKYIARYEASNEFHSIFWPMVNIFLVVVFILVKSYIFSLDKIAIFPDTTSYTLAADIAFFNKRFWLSHRPVALPLIYKLFGAEGELYLISTETLRRITVFQFLFSVFSWLALGFSLRSVLRTSWLRVLGCFVILGFGAALDISQWDKILLSESLSLSLFALLVSSMIWVYQYGIEINKKRSARSIIFFIIITVVIFLYSTTRDINSFFIIAAALPTLFWIISSLRNHKLFRLETLLLGSMVLAFGYQYISGSVGHRAEIPLQNVIYYRILPQQTSLRFFIDKGMPLEDDDIKVLRNHELEGYRSLLEAGPLGDVGDWIREYGRSSYLEFLIINLWPSIIDLFSEMDHVIAPDNSEYRNSIHETPNWVNRFSALFHPKSLLLNLSLFSIPTLLILWKRTQNTEFDMWLLVPFLLLMSAFPLSFIVYHADAIEFERHAFQISVQLKMAGFLLIIGYTDRIASKEKVRNT